MKLEWRLFVLSVLISSITKASSKNYLENEHSLYSGEGSGSGDSTTDATYTTNQQPTTYNDTTTIFVPYTSQPPTTKQETTTISTTYTPYPTVPITEVECEAKNFSCGENCTVTFPTTSAGFSSNSEQYCDDHQKIPQGTCLCKTTGEWAKPVIISDCNNDLQSLADKPITTNTTDEEKHEVANDLVILTSQPESLEEEDITTSIEVVNEIVETSEILEQNTTSLLVATASNLIEASSSISSDNNVTESILKVLNDVASKVNISEDEVYESTSPQVSITVYKPPLPSSDEKEETIKAGIDVKSLKSSNNNGFRQDQVRFTNKKLNDKESSEILVTFKNTQDSRISFNAFFNDSIFQSSNPQNGDTGVNSDYILSATILEASEDIIDKVEITFKLNNEQDSQHTTDCAFWNDTALMWVIDGTFNKTQVDETSISCQFNHLTNFAALFTYSNTTVENFGLTIVTVVGCSISLLGQLLTIITYVIFKMKYKTFKYKRSLYLLNLAIALILLNTFLLVSNSSAVINNPNSCVAISVCLHFSLIAVFSWTTADTFCLFLIVNFPYYASSNAESQSFSRKVSAIAWTCPIIYVALPAALKLDIYKRVDNVCWLDSNWIVYLVIIPIAIILFVNILAFVTIFYIAKCRPRPGNVKKEQSRSKNLIFGLSVFVTIGGTWTIGFFISPFANLSPELSLAISYIFAIVNSLQGGFLFLLFMNVTMKSNSELKKKRRNYKNIKEDRIRTHETTGFSSSSTSIHY